MTSKKFWILFFKLKLILHVVLRYISMNSIFEILDFNLILGLRFLDNGTLKFKIQSEAF